MNLSINCVFIIESLSNSETRTGANIYNDIVKWRTEAKGLQSDLVEVDNKEQMERFFAEVLMSVKDNDLKPYFHFEIHGNKSGFVLNSGEIYTWNELYSHLQSINIACRNNLWISLATCFGAYIFSIIKPTAPAPFFGYIGAWNILYADEIESGFSEYFDILLTEWNLNKALDVLNAETQYSDQYGMYHSAAVFAKIYENYETENYSANGFKLRVDQLMKSFLDTSITENEKTKEEMRKKIESLLIDKREDYKLIYRKKFLMLDLYPEQEGRHDAAFNDF